MALSRSGGGTDLAAPAPEEDLEMLFQERADEALQNLSPEHKKAITRWNDMDWKYFDVAMIHVRAGKGGRGCKAFFRQPNEPMGGPCGGNGGRGGSVYLRCIPEKWNLFYLKTWLHFRAADGGFGKGRFTDGRDGKDFFVDVPAGVCVYVRDSWLEGADRLDWIGPNGRNQMLTWEEVGTRHLVGELTKPGQTLRVARGGLGGRGNRSLKTPYNSAPWLNEQGEQGGERWIELELKHIADVGIIGVPNAGKTSLLCAVTRKMAKIAAYPFTTVSPNLGTYKANQHADLTMVDVPGLIDGAAEGKGLGIQFLRHIERCRTLMHVVSLDSEDPLHDFDCVQQSLAQYSAEVAAKPQVVVVNKCDIDEKLDMLPQLMAALRKRCGHSRVFDISVATQYHVKDLMKRVFKWHKSIVEKELKEMDTSYAESGLPSTGFKGGRHGYKENKQTEQRRPFVEGEAEAELEEARLMVGQRQGFRIGGGIERATTTEPIVLDPDRIKGRRLRKHAIESRIEWDTLDSAWRCLHPEVVRVANQTIWQWDEAWDRFNRVLKATGTNEALVAVGAQVGDIVIAGNHQFRYSPDNIGNETRMLAYELSWEKPEPPLTSDHGRGGWGT